LLTDLQKKHIIRIWNIASLLQWSLTQLAYCQSSKCPPLARTGIKMRCPLLRYQLHFVEGRAKCPTVPHRHQLVTDTDTLAARQGSK